MKTYFKQLAAYLQAHNEIYDTKVEQVAVLNIFGKKPEEVGSQIILLSSDELIHYTDLFQEDLSSYNELILKS